MKESAYFLTYATNILQGTKYPTASLILPILGKVAYYAKADTPLKFEKTPVKITNEAVVHARDLFEKALSRK